MVRWMIPPVEEPMDSDAEEEMGTDAEDAENFFSKRNLPEI